MGNVTITIVWVKLSQKQRVVTENALKNTKDGQKENVQI
jgi:hypothetical protein